jgi:methylenetetrahydrofolate dehydrogenase (NADP+)/methenyltetrahydrofolate cyclohydrolase
MVEVFDGKSFSEKKLANLKRKVLRLRKVGVVPKLISIVVGNEGGALQYQKLKKKSAESMGLELQVREFSSSVTKKEITDYIEKINRDDSVHGIMVQLPLPSKFSQKVRDSIINFIDSKKDVDGMRENSLYKTPVVKAVMEVLGHAPVGDRKNADLVLLGSKGFVGNKLARQFLVEGYKVRDYDLETSNLDEATGTADILISATGREGLIKKDMVKKSAILIDVGSPKGDIKKEAYKKARFVSPVPGGVGPVTILYLLQNLLKAAQ